MYMYDEYYYGKEEYEKFGEMVSKKLAGRTISKRIVLADDPGGIRYEAKKLGLDTFELLRTLEGMCCNGDAEEIDDSTYLVYD